MPDRIGRLIDGLLSWLVTNLEFFSLPKDDGPTQTDLDIHPQRQAFGELALLCMVLHRNSTIRGSHEFGLLLNHLEIATSDSDYGLDIMTAPHLFPAYLMEFSCLKACGKTHPGRQAALQRILDFGFVTGVERTAWNQMDFLYFLELGGFRHSLPELSVLYRTSSAFRLPPIPYVRIIDIYALTHIIFFAADFGRRDLRPLLGARYARTCEELALLLGTQLHEGDWDLASELLISCHCLQHYPALLIDLTFEALSRSQSPEGDIPGRAFDPNSPDLACTPTRKTYQFWRNYHPTLVTAAAAALCIS